MIKKIPQDTEYFHYFNANPNDRRTADCVLRAISLSAGKTWDEVLDGLVEIAHKYKVMVNDTPCYDRYLKSLGYVKMKQPKKADNTKYTGKEFCTYLFVNCTHGEQIVAHIGGGHIVAIVPTYEGDGINYRYKVIDTWNSTYKTIGNYWIRRR